MPIFFARNNLLWLWFINSTLHKWNIWRMQQKCNPSLSRLRTYSGSPNHRLGLYGASAMKATQSLEDGWVQISFSTCPLERAEMHSTHFFSASHIDKSWCYVTISSQTSVKRYHLFGLLPMRPIRREIKPLIVSKYSGKQAQPKMPSITVGRTQMLKQPSRWRFEQQ